MGCVGCFYTLSCLHLLIYPRSWVDADTIILNPNIQWESFLPPGEDFSDIHLIGAKDWNGWNCGVFFVRVNAWSVEMLRDVAALPSLRPEV